MDTLRFLSQAVGLVLRGRRRREHLAALQQARWRSLLQFVADRSPFYQRQLQGLDLGRCQLEDVPPLTKAAMMAHFDELVTDPAIHLADVRKFTNAPANLGRFFLGRYSVCHTSGSQGQPAVVVQKKSALLLGVAVQAARGQALGGMAREFFDRVRRPARLAVVTQKPGFYPSGSTFSYLRQMRLPFFDLLHLSVFDPMPEVVRRLNEFQPDYVTAYTYALEALAREQEEGRLRLRAEDPLRQLNNISEPLPELSRRRIEEAFGVHVADIYSMAECMALTSGCPYGSGAHVNTDLAVLEVVDDAYRPVPDGEPGTRVLITNLYNRVQPLIRYEIGDVVTMSREPCPCGSPFPLVESIGGRTKERFWVEVHGQCREIPYFVFLAALHHCAEMAEHQVLQTGWNRFVVRAAPQPGKVLSLERVDALIRQSLAAEGLAHAVAWEVQIVDEIPPEPGSGKIQRARNLVGPPPVLTPIEATTMRRTAVRAPLHAESTR